MTLYAPGWPFRFGNCGHFARTAIDARSTGPRWPPSQEHGWSFEEGTQDSEPGSGSPTRREAAGHRNWCSAQVRRASRRERGVGLIGAPEVTGPHRSDPHQLDARTTSMGSCHAHFVICVALSNSSRSTDASITDFGVTARKAIAPRWEGSSATRTEAYRTPSEVLVEPVPSADWRPRHIVAVTLALWIPVAESMERAVRIDDPTGSAHGPSNSMKLIPTNSFSPLRFVKLTSWTVWPFSTVILSLDAEESIRQDFDMGFRITTLLQLSFPLRVHQLSEP